jgi:alpha/beta superfamily hydrolase
MQSELRLPDPGESRELTAEGPAGRLQARLSLPAERARPEGAALICHPHPNYGGTMDNKVVYMLSRACDRAGLAALRFNFRGVGQSEGEFGVGRCETDDCLAMAALLKATLPEARIVLAGFSFGAFVSLRAAHQIKPVQLVSVAPPLDYFQGRNHPCPSARGWWFRAMRTMWWTLNIILKRCVRWNRAPISRSSKGWGTFFTAS